MVIVIARALQILGLAYLPIGLWRGLAADDLRGEMMFLGAGTLLFLGGRWMEGRRRR